MGGPYPDSHVSRDVLNLDEITVPTIQAMLGAIHEGKQR